MTSAPITVTLMKTHEVRGIECFVNDAMRRHYACDAYPLPKHVLIARRSGSILGTIGISRPSGGLLPIERLYVIDDRSFPKGKRPDIRSLVQLGRWVTEEPNVSLMLMYEAARYARARKYAWAISEVKPQVVRRFRAIGIRLILLAGVVRMDRVPFAVRSYYDPPTPVLAMVSLAKLEAACKRSLSLQK